MVAPSTMISTDPSLSPPTPLGQWPCVIEVVVYRELEVESGMNAFHGAATQLPGTIGVGDSIGETVDSVLASVRSLLLSYAELGQPVPWSAATFEADESSELVSRQTVRLVDSERFERG